MNPETGRALGFVASERRVWFSQWGAEGGHVMAYEALEIDAESSTELVIYAVLAETAEELRLFGALGDLPS